MAGFDKSLDVEIFSTKKEYETSKLVVSVMQYNEGAKKIQLSKETLDMNTGDWKWAKLGRLTKEEATEVQSMIGECLEHLE